MEGSEESGSMDMDYYMEFLKERIGSNVKAIWILDSGAGNYETFWLNSSLRGVIGFFLEI